MYFTTTPMEMYAGYTTLENDATQISVMGDDASTEEIDEFTNGNQFEYIKGIYLLARNTLPQLITALY